MKPALLFSFILFCNLSFSQNLITNAGFESNTTIPYSAGQWNLCTGWSNCSGTGSPDYFHTSGGGNANLPNSFVSYLLPYGGNAIMGFCPYYALNTPNFREYVSKPLITPLVPGTSYEVSFFITNGKTSGVYGGQGIDAVSVAFTVGQPIQSGWGPITSISPQWTSPTILYDTAWQQITFQFTATEAYDHVTFGNFKNDANTNAENFDVATNLVAYYYLDSAMITLADNSSISAALGVSDSTVCMNSCVSFSDLSTNNPATWQWSFPGANPSASTLQNPSFICYDTPGVYDVTLIAGNGVSMDTLFLPGFITVYPDPVPVISVSGNLLTSSAGQEYQWYYNGNLINGATDQSFIAQQSGNYSVFVIDVNGCSGWAEAEIHLTQFSSADTVICEKYCTGFFDASVNEPVSWLWQFPGAIPSASTQQHPSNICYNLPGTYDVTLITTGSFGPDTLTLTNYIEVIETPVIPVVTQDGNTLTSTAAYSYQWQLNTVDIPGATNQSYTVMQSGYYTVVTGNEEGCSSSSAVLNVLISGVEEQNPANYFALYPNPSDGIFQIEFGAGVLTGSVSIRIFNSIGQETDATISDNSSSMSGILKVGLTDAADGLYLVEIRTGPDLLRRKLIISNR